MAVQIASSGSGTERGTRSPRRTVRCRARDHGDRRQELAACPHCGNRRVQRYGSFRWKDGTRRSRFRCLACGRTFNPHTGTPMHYLKKREQWARQAPGLGQALSVRRMANELGIQVPTAFRWRHRLLAALHRRPQPRFTGAVAAAASYIPYSEKGSRTTRGPGSWGARRQGLHRGRLGSLGQGGRERFRLFFDGKPSCVLLACDGDQRAAVIMSQGRPGPEALQRCLASLLMPGATLWTFGSLPFITAACRHLGLAHRDPWRLDAKAATLRLQGGAERFLTLLRTWIRRFHGVATKYLAHYLVWYRHVFPNGALSPQDVGRQMLAAAMERPCPTALRTGAA